MLAIADGKDQLAHYVDDRTGVVFIDDSPDPSDGASGTRPERPALECGARLTALIAKWEQRMASKTDGVRAAYDENRLTCVNRPPPATCTFGRSGEWDPAVHFVFRVDAARGVMLRAITLDDEVLVDSKVVDARHRSHARLTERLAAPGCPAAP